MLSFLVCFILLSCLFVIFSNKIEFSVFSLIFTFALSGILFIFIGVPLFGFIYLIVYTAAISILFLFVIMMLDIPIVKSSNPFSIFLLIFFIFPFFFLINSSPSFFDIIYHQEWNIIILDTMQSLAYVLYSEQLSLLLILSIILLIVMVALIHFLYSNS